MCKKVTTRFLLLSLFIVSVLSAKAETFWVTSKADAGPNTLREALQRAAANGVAEQDSILFNLPGNTLADRTIVLISALPAMTSNLVIDGTSQPGKGFGAGFAKVKLEIAKVPQPYDQYNIPFFLEAIKAEKIAVFGLFFHYSEWTIFSTFELCGGVRFLNCKKIRVGAAGKGNIFKGVYTAVAAASEIHTSAYDPKSDSLVVQGNMVGFTENGDLPYVSGDNFNYAEYFVTTSYFSNILIGGDTEAEGNIVNAATLSIYGMNSIQGGTIKIANNAFCVSSRRNPGIDSSQLAMSLTLKDVKQKLLIEKNILHGSIHLNDLLEPFSIRGNLLLNGLNMHSNLTSNVLIDVFSCKGGGIIGGDGLGDGNELTSYYTRTIDSIAFFSFDAGAIITQTSPNVSIIKNKIHCVNHVGPGIISFGGNTFREDPLPESFVRITSQTPTLITGKATPSSRIDLYYDDDCTACEGEIHIGTTTSSVDSSWQFSGNFTKTVLATVTNSKGATSEFTQPRFANREIKVTHTRCNNNIGSIKGIKLYGNWDDILWFKYDFDSQNGTLKMVPLAKTLDLENLSEGTYYFRVKYKNTCVAPIGEFKIYNIEYYITDNNALIKQPACNQASGKISQVYVGSGNGNYADAIKYWEDDKGNRYPDEELSMSYASISRLKPGYYRLILKDTLGGCSDTSRWFTLVNQPGPAINETAVKITNASCQLANGTIVGMQIVNPGNNPYIAWLDSSNTIVGNEMNLSNTSIGKYRLAYWDDGGCDTLYSNWYHIGAAGAILIDATKPVITSSQCIKATGTIKGIMSFGSYVYKWIDSTGTTTATSLDPGLLFPGKYMLKISSAEGCDSVLGPYVVPTIPTFDYDPQLQVSYLPGTCAANNGSVTILNHPSLPGYSYRWVAGNTGNGPSLSTTFSLPNMTVGTTYYFFLKDSKGCEQLGFTAQNNVQFPKPLLNETALLIQPVTCVTSGSIAGLSVTQNPSAQPFQYVWRNAAGDSIANSINIGQLMAGAYTLQVTDRYNCSISKTFAVGSSIVNLAAPVYTDLRIKRGTNASIAATNVQAGGNHSLFATPAATVAVQQNANGRFDLGTISADTNVYVAFEKDGCISPKTIVRIFVYDEISIHIPNAFSPNNDGVNDVMTIKTQGIAALQKLTVFDRYGAIVYSSREPQKGWNGQSAKGNLPAGTYYYILEATGQDNKPLRKQGSVLLLR